MRAAPGRNFYGYKHDPQDKGKKPIKKRGAGERAGLENSKIVSTASQLLEIPGSLKVETLAKALGVVPTTIRSRFRGGISQICTEIARKALAGSARPYRPRDTPSGYLTELFLGRTAETFWQAHDGAPRCN